MTQVHSPPTPLRTPFKPCEVISIVPTIFESLNQITGGGGLDGARAGRGRASARKVPVNQENSIVYESIPYGRNNIL